MLSPAKRPAAAKRVAAPQRPKATARSRAAQRPGVREQAAQATREAILKSAIKVFAKHGYAGGRVEQISRAARSHDRMIYYYFGSKEALFVAVIEEIYRRFNEAEASLALELDKPEQALRDIVAFIWAYYQKHPEFITLLNSENLHRGVHMARAGRPGEYAHPALSVLEGVLRRGAQTGAFRPDLRARDLYLMIAALGYFYLSNRFTLSVFLGEDLQAPDALSHWQDFITDAVMRAVAATPIPPSPIPT